MSLNPQVNLTRENILFLGASLSDTYPIQKKKKQKQPTVLMWHEIQSKGIIILTGITAMLLQHLCRVETLVLHLQACYCA